MTCPNCGSDGAMDFGKMLLAELNLPHWRPEVKLGMAFALKWYAQVQHDSALEATATRLINELRWCRTSEINTPPPRPVAPASTLLPPPCGAADNVTAPQGGEAHDDPTDGSHG
jgi:hypothetical protein